MNKSYLKQMLSYFSKVYHLGEKIKNLKDGRIDPQIKTSTISFIVLFSFICRLQSFNRVKHWLGRGKFKKLFPKKTRLPHIDAVRRSLSNFNIDSLDNMHDHIVKTIFKNKVFRKGITHYFHRAVVCATIGLDPHIVLGYEMLEPKNDGSDKDEGEITGGKRLIRKLYGKFHHFADIIVADALYCKAPWLKEVLLTQLYFFRNIRGFKEKGFLQIDIIEDLKDEMLIIMNWNNPVFNTA